jgi:hypothetical protein
MKYLHQGIYKQGCYKVPSCTPHCTQKKKKKKKKKKIFINIKKFLYKYYKPQTPGFYLGLFADDTCIYATDYKGGYALRELK